MVNKDINQSINKITVFDGIMLLKLEKAENISTKYDSFTNL